MKDYSNMVELYLAIGETEYLCEVEFDYYPGDPGRYYGPWEDCYPATDPELEINSVKILGHSNNAVIFDASCLLANKSFYDYVESEICKYQEDESDKYAALQEDYDESRHYNSVSYW